MDRKCFPADCFRSGSFSPGFQLRLRRNGLSAADVLASIFLGKMAPGIGRASRPGVCGSRFIGTRATTAIRSGLACHRCAMDGRAKLRRTSAGTAQPRGCWVQARHDFISKSTRTSAREPGATRTSWNHLLPQRRATRHRPSAETAGAPGTSPLSDQEVVARLKTKGITIARRPVAKYRSELEHPTVEPAEGLLSSAVGV